MSTIIEHALFTKQFGVFTASRMLMVGRETADHYFFIEYDPFCESETSKRQVFKTEAAARAEYDWWLAKMIEDNWKLTPPVRFMVMVYNKLGKYYEDYTKTGVSYEEAKRIADRLFQEEDTYTILRKIEEN